MLATELLRSNVNPHQSPNTSAVKRRASLLLLLLLLLPSYLLWRCDAFWLHPRHGGVVWSGCRIFSWPRPPIPIPSHSWSSVRRRRRSPPIPRCSSRDAPAAPSRHGTVQSQSPIALGRVKTERNYRTHAPTATATLSPSLNVLSIHYTTLSSSIMSLRHITLKRCYFHRTTLLFTSSSRSRCI